MTLRRKPFEPKPTPRALFGHYLAEYRELEAYLGG